MNAHLQYARYVARHKWFVLRAGLKTGAPLWRLRIHDWSKLTPAEWRPYLAKFYGALSDESPATAAFRQAWLHHQHASPHHWQHWVLRNDDGSTAALAMPYPLVREMVADWAGAGRAITGSWEEVAGWYALNRDKMLLHPITRRRVERVLAEACA